jgi:hypothetical protein
MKTKLSVAWFCASDKHAEVWQFAGASVAAAQRVGREMFAEKFWIAPGHPTTAAEEADGQEHDYTVETEHAQQIA